MFVEQMRLNIDYVLYKRWNLKLTYAGKSMYIKRVALWSVWKKALSKWEFINTGQFVGRICLTPV